MAKMQTRPWDAAEHLETAEDMAAYLEAALDEGDAALVAAALGDIARAKGMAQIARETGLGRESLYKALSPEGNPEFATVLKVVRALRLRLHATTEQARKNSKKGSKVNQTNHQELYEIIPILRELIREEISPLSQRLDCLEESFNKISDSIRFSQQLSIRKYITAYGQTPQSPQLPRTLSTSYSQPDKSARTGQEMQSVTQGMPIGSILATIGDNVI
jgi:probable addiction module antidote protein